MVEIRVFLIIIMNLQIFLGCFENLKNFIKNFKVDRFNNLFFKEGVKMPDLVQCFSVDEIN